MKMKRKEIELQLLSLMREFLKQLQAERAMQAISLDASLERNLGIDSLSRVEIFHRIEKTFAIHLPERAITQAKTLNDLVDLIEQASADLPVQMIQDYSQILEVASISPVNETTLVDVLAAYAAKEPERPHIYLQNERGEEDIIRYGQLYEEAKAVACGLSQKGIQPGETIAIMLPTSKEFFYAFMGILLAGAVPVPIYPPFRPEQLEDYVKRDVKILNNAEVRLLITFAEANTLSSMLRTFVPSLKAVSTLKELQIYHEQLPERFIDENDIAFIQYTSGSTGDPKGVTLTHKNILANIRAIGDAVPIKPTDIIVSWLPLYHDMGLMNWIGSLYFGIPVTILSPITFLTRPEKWLWAIHYHRATFAGAPNFAYELCVKEINASDIEGLDLSSWRFAFCGAEAVNPKTLHDFYQKFKAYGFSLESFAPAYGLAEAVVGLTVPQQRRKPLIDKIERDMFETQHRAVTTTLLNEKDYLEFVSCGQPLPQHQVRIVDDVNNPVAERVVANVQFRGPSSMIGYFNNPTITQKAYHDGWWDSGDLGYMVGQELFITGRKKELIIKAGRHFFPEEIEELVSTVPAIIKGCVIAFGISDPNIGTEKLIIVAETNQLKKEKQQEMQTMILATISQSLDISPDAIVLVAPNIIPKTPSGKLQRALCKKAYLDGELIKYRLPLKLQLAKLALLSMCRRSFDSLIYGLKLIYSIYIAIVLIIGFPIVRLLITPLSPSLTAKVAKFFARLFFRVAFCPINVNGREYLSNETPMIYVANHASYADSVVLAGILPSDIAFVAKKELLQVPILRTFIKKLRYITVDRIDFTKSIDIKNTIEEVLMQKRSIVIFPEGTFTYATGLRPFKLGAFIIASEMCIPVCPIAIKGTRSILRGDSLLAKPGIVTVTIAKPIYSEGKEWNDVIKLHSLVRAEIAKHCGESAIDVIAAGIEKSKN